MCVCVGGGTQGGRLGQKAEPSARVRVRVNVRVQGCYCPVLLP